MAKKVLAHTMSEPLGGVSSARADINTGTGNLTIDGFTDGQQLLASGVLEYMDGQDPPAPSVDTINGQITFTLKADGGRRPSLRMPWSACNAETNWQIHLNPAVLSDIAAHSGGGNVALDLSGMAITAHVSAETGGGNVDLVLPDHAADLDATATSGGGNVNIEIGSDTKGSNSVKAKSGAGNVVVRVPSGLAGCIHATTGMGKAIIDPRFSRIDGNTYQSADYDSATDRVEITIKSGAGNVSVATK